MTRIVTPLNRFQAIIRHPDYRMEVRPYLPQKLGLLNFMSEIAGGRLAEQQWRIYVEGYVVTRRWGLDHLVDPEDNAQIAGELTKLQRGGHSIFSKDPHFQVAGQYEPQIDPGNLTPVTIYLDLRQPDMYLKEHFLKIVQELRATHNITPGRSKDNVEDIWKVWDMLEVHKKSYQEIACALCGECGDPVVDETAKAAKDRIQRAHRKATRFIKEVGDSRNNSITYEVVETSLIRSIKKLFQMLSRPSSWP